MLKTDNYLRFLLPKLQILFQCDWSARIRLSRKHLQLIFVARSRNIFDRDRSGIRISTVYSLHYPTLAPSQRLTFSVFVLFHSVRTWTSFSLAQRSWQSVNKSIIGSCIVGEIPLNEYIEDSEMILILEKIREVFRLLIERLFAMLWIFRERRMIDISCAEVVAQKFRLSDLDTWKILMFLRLYWSFSLLWLSSNSEPSDKFRRKSSRPVLYEKMQISLLRVQINVAMVPTKVKIVNSVFTFGDLLSEFIFRRIYI